ncbi:MAG: DNA gyrase C-terminal beta-propeller domain-containing protein, partial [Planctomycetota bacterium]
KGSVGGKTKEGDYVEHFFIASTHDYLLVFTSLGKLHWLKVYDIPEFSKQAKGRALVNLLNMSKVEKVSACIQVREFETGQNLFFVTQNGLIKKTELAAYKNVTVKGIRAIKLNEGDRLIDVMLTNGEDEIVIATKKGYAIRFFESDARKMGRVTAGVKGMGLRKGDEVVDAAVVNRSAALLTVSAKGYGKRTKFDEYKIQKRGGKGIINLKVTDKTAEVVAAKSIFEGDEIMMMTKGGVVLRTIVNAKNMRSIGRATQGVRLMKMSGNDQIMSVVKIMNEEEAFEKVEEKAADDHVDDVIAKGVQKFPEKKGKKKKKDDAEEE